MTTSGQDCLCIPSRRYGQRGARTDRDEEEVNAVGIQEGLRAILDRELSFVPNRRYQRLSESEAQDLESLDIDPLMGTGKTGTGRLSNLCRTGLLSADQEKRLFQRLNFLKYQATQLRSRVNLHRPDRSLVARLEFLLAEADRTLDVLVSANVRLVLSIVRRTRSSHASFDELLSDGLVALVRAAEKFDESRGFRFSTYATMVVRRELFRSIQSAHSLHQKHFSMDRSELSNSLESRALPRLPLGQWSALYETLETMLNTLEPREREIVSARFGFESIGTKPSLQAVADRMGICKERVRQLEKRAMAKLRNMALQHGLSRFEASLD